MTREEEIQIAAEEHAIYTNDERLNAFPEATRPQLSLEYNSDDLADAFDAGAKWADNHPAKKQTIWKNASQTPSEKSEIVLIDTNGEWYNISYSFDEYDDALGKGWESCVRTYNIDKWTYLDDLINL